MLRMLSFLRVMVRFIPSFTLIIAAVHADNAVIYAGNAAIHAASVVIFPGNAAIDADIARIYGRRIPFNVLPLLIDLAFFFLKQVIDPRLWIGDPRPRP